MLEVLPGPDHILAIRLSGKLTGEDYDRIASELSTRLRRHERMGIYTETQDWRGMSAAALARDLRFAFARVGELQRFPRAAVVTDMPWLRTVANVGDAALPPVEIRTFEPSQKERALTWVAELPDQPRMPALRVIPTTRDDTYAFVWNGRISVEDAVEFEKAFQPVLERHGKIRLLGRIDHMGGIAAGAITESGLLPLKRKLLRKVERYAIVGGPRWVSRYVGFIRPWTKIEVRHFDSAAEDEAWTWLEARPRETNGPGDAFDIHLNG
jgi:hypothetical protein